jgi:hypothetical protein
MKTHDAEAMAEPVMRFFEIRSGTLEYGWCGGFHVGIWPGRNETEALAAYANDPMVPKRYVGRTEVRHSVKLNLDYAIRITRSSANGHGCTGHGCTKK